MKGNLCRHIDIKNIYGTFISVKYFKFWNWKYGLKVQSEKKNRFYSILTSLVGTILEKRAVHQDKCCFWEHSVYDYCVKWQGWFINEEVVRVLLVTELVTIISYN